MARSRHATASSWAACIGGQPTINATACQAAALVVAALSQSSEGAEDGGLLRRLSIRARPGERTLIMVSIAGPPPKIGDLLIGVEAAQGLPPSVILVRRDGYAAWATVHRGTSLDQAYEQACRVAPHRPRLPLARLVDQLVSELSGG